MSHSSLTEILSARGREFTLVPSLPRTPGFRLNARSRQGHAADIQQSVLEGSIEDDSISRAVATPEPLGSMQENERRALARAREEAFAAGLAEGARQTESALDVRLDELDRLSAALATARTIDADRLAPALAATTQALLAALLAADPGLETRGLEERARVALDQLSADHAPATLWLAPAQAAALAPRLSRPMLNVVADPTLTPGALRLTSGAARLDDSPGTRLARLALVIADPTANERQGDDASSAGSMFLDRQ